MLSQRQALGATGQRTLDGEISEFCCRKAPRLDSVTSAQGLQALPGMAVQFLHAGWPGGWEEDVSLLVPLGPVVHTQLTLDVQVGDGCKTRRETGLCPSGALH